MSAPSTSRAALLYLLPGLAVACLAVSSQSFWIDEAQTALKAVQPTLAGWWHTLYVERNSNLQLPLYMIYVWGWARIFGVSEFALRAANIPCFLLGFVAIFYFLRRHPGLRGATLLVYCLHPFVWYYLNEARPYLMQLSGALLVAGCLFAALDEAEDPFPSSWWWLFLLGLTILCGAGILGVPWAIAIGLLLVFRPGFWKSIPRSGIPALVVFLPILGFLALYFAWTIKAKIGTGTLNSSLASMLAFFYEQFGFLGLGPGRAVLRVASLRALRPYLGPIALLALPLAWGIIPAVRRRFGLSPARFASILLLTASPVCLIFALAYARHARILGRHLTPLFPFILLAQAYILLLLWKSRRPLNRAAAALILFALTLSSLETRFAFRHSKDDYRAAAAAANDALAQGKTVWWSAAIEGAQIYHLPIDSRDVPGTARWVFPFPADHNLLPDQIYVSKPDLFDDSGGLASMIATHHYHPTATWQAITLWEK